MAVLLASLKSRYVAALRKNRSQHTASSSTAGVQRGDGPLPAQCACVDLGVDTGD